METLEMEPEVVGGVAAFGALTLPVVEVIDEVVVMPVERAELDESVDGDEAGRVVASAAAAEADEEDEDEDEDDESDEDEDDEEDEDEDDEEDGDDDNDDEEE